MQNLLFALSTLLIFSCSKTKEPPQEPNNNDAIVSIETVDLSNENKLTASISAPIYDYRIVQKATFSSGLIAYNIPSIVDKTKHLVKFTRDNIKYVQAISNDSTISLGIKLFSLKSLTGKLYYSMKVRKIDMHYAELKVENELPLYILGTGTGMRKWYDCMKSRVYACGASWKCTLSCTVFTTMYQTGMCGMQMAISCL